MNQPTLTHEQAQEMVQAALAPLQEGIEALIKKALQDHEHGMAAANIIPLKELKPEHAMVRPHTLPGNVVVILSRHPIESPDGVNRYKLIATKLPGAEQPTPEHGEKLVPFEFTIFQEDPHDITLTVMVSPTPMIYDELMRQLEELGPSFDGAAMFHMAILTLSMEAVEVPDLPTPA